jgi:hypothetical protein
MKENKAVWFADELGEKVCFFFMLFSCLFVYSCFVLFVCLFSFEINKQTNIDNTTEKREQKKEEQNFWDTLGSQGPISTLVNILFGVIFIVYFILFSFYVMLFIFFANEQ